MLWIKNTKAWMLLRGIIMLGVFILLAWIFIDQQQVLDRGKRIE